MGGACNEGLDEINAKKAKKVNEGGDEGDKGGF